MTRRSFRPDCYRVTMALLFLLALLVPTASHAQTSTPAQITEFQLLILPGTGDPATLQPVATQTTTIGPTANCGLPMPTTQPPATATNPNLFWLNDPFTAGMACRLSFPTNLPAGTYQWAGVFRAAQCNPTGTQVISPCPSDRSAAGTPPFSIVNLTTKPPAPTGLRF